MKKFVKKIIRRILRLFGYQIRRINYKNDLRFIDINQRYWRIIQTIRPYTMVNIESIVTFLDLIKHVTARKIPGSIVECGVWRGGMMMGAALYLIEEGDLSRDLYLFDTFEGMPKSGEYDYTYNGITADKFLNDVSKQYDFIFESFAQDIKTRLIDLGYPEHKIHVIQGDVCKTLPHPSISHIAVAHLDTDFYESIKHELKHLCPLVNNRGGILIDDYGYWKGCQKAVDEYLDSTTENYLLQRIDFTGRLLIRQP